MASQNSNNPPRSGSKRGFNSGKMPTMPQTDASDENQSRDHIGYQNEGQTADYNDDDGDAYNEPPEHSAQVGKMVTEPGALDGMGSVSPNREHTVKEPSPPKACSSTSDNEHGTSPAGRHQSRVLDHEDNQPPAMFRGRPRVAQVQSDDEESRELRARIYQDHPSGGNADSRGSNPQDRGRGGQYRPIESDLSRGGQRDSTQSGTRDNMADRTDNVSGPTKDDGPQGKRKLVRANKPCNEYGLQYPPQQYRPPQGHYFTFATVKEMNLGIKSGNKRCFRCHKRRDGNDHPFYRDCNERCGFCKTMDHPNGMPCPLMYMNQNQWNKVAPPPHEMTEFPSNVHLSPNVEEERLLIRHGFAYYNHKLKLTFYDSPRTNADTDPIAPAAPGPRVQGSRGSQPSAQTHYEKPPPHGQQDRSRSFQEDRTPHTHEENVRLHQLQIDDDARLAAEDLRRLGKRSLELDQQWYAVRREHDSLIKQLELSRQREAEVATAREEGKHLYDTKLLEVTEMNARRRVAYENRYESRLGQDHGSTYDPSRGSHHDNASRLHHAQRINNDYGPGPRHNEPPMTYERSPNHSGRSDNREPAWERDRYNTGTRNPSPASRSTRSARPEGRHWAPYPSRIGGGNSRRPEMHQDERRSRR